MPVSTPHPEVERFAPEWRKIQACIDGEKTIKEAGTEFLPRSEGVSDTTYNNYKARAVWFNATARTLGALMGFLFRKPPTIEGLPTSLDKLEQDADMAGAGLKAYARKIADRVGSVGRCGTLVEWSTAEARPYFAFYEASGITNWQTERIGGNLKLTALVLREAAYKHDTNDRWKTEIVIKYREFYLEGDPTNPKSLRCMAQIWEEANGGGVTSSTKTAPQQDPVKVGEPIQIFRRNVPLDFIPFQFHNAENPGEGISKPPLTDIADVNISHYRTSADLENGRHFCGCPTPWAKCFDEKKDDGSGVAAVKSEALVVGSNVAWTSDNADAECGYLEFTGAGLNSLEKALEEKQTMMASLGARLVEPKTGDAKAFATVALENSSDSSTLARIGELVSEGITDVLQIAAWWASSDATVDEKIQFSLNSDFNPAVLTSEMLTALTGAWQANAISRGTLYHNFRRGELLPPGRTDEEEKEAIEADPPVLPPTPGTGNQDPPANNE